MADSTTKPIADTDQPSAKTETATKPRESEDEMRAKMIAQHQAMRCVGCGEGQEYF